MQLQLLHSLDMTLVNGKGYRDTRVARSHDHTVTRTAQVRARSIGLIRIRTLPFSDEAFD